MSAKITIEVYLGDDSIEPFDGAITEITATPGAEEHVVAAGLMALEIHIARGIRAEYEAGLPSLSPEVIEMMVAPVARLTLQHEAMHTPTASGTDLLPD